MISEVQKASYGISVNDVWWIIIDHCSKKATNKHFTFQQFSRVKEVFFFCKVIFIITEMTKKKNSEYGDSCGLLVFFVLLVAALSYLPLQNHKFHLRFSINFSNEFNVKSKLLFNYNNWPRHLTLVLIKQNNSY